MTICVAICVAICLTIYTTVFMSIYMTICMIICITIGMTMCSVYSRQVGKSHLSEVFLRATAMCCYDPNSVDSVRSVGLRNGVALSSKVMGVGKSM